MEVVLVSGAGVHRHTGDCQHVPVMTVSKEVSEQRAIVVREITDMLMSNPSVGAVSIVVVPMDDDTVYTCTRLTDPPSNCETLAKALRMVAKAAEGSKPGEFIVEYIPTQTN